MGPRGPEPAQSQVTFRVVTNAPSSTSGEGTTQLARCDLDGREVEARRRVDRQVNAHRTGLGAPWAGTLAYWSQPNPENEAAATAHLTFEGTRDQYLAGVPPDVAARIPAEGWEEDWRVMRLPGRMDSQRALIADYAHYVERFDSIADYLARWQPPALMLWGRHDAFFDLAETLSWMRALPRMEAHVFDAGHLLLETHAAAAASLMLGFIRRTRRQGE
jgi:pimeloyl-ACP methyl ester carboxylesterase